MFGSTAMPDRNHASVASEMINMDPPQHTRGLQATPLQIEPVQPLRVLRKRVQWGQTRALEGTSASPRITYHTLCTEKFETPLKHIGFPCGNPDGLGQSAAPVEFSALAGRGFSSSKGGALVRTLWWHSRVVQSSWYVSSVRGELPATESSVSTKQMQLVERRLGSALAVMWFPAATS